jgi:hypothetical protein
MLRLFFYFIEGKLKNSNENQHHCHPEKLFTLIQNEVKASFLNLFLTAALSLGVMGYL